MNADQTVTAFCDALTRSDLDGAMKLVADDCVYHNIPLDPVTGPAAIRATLEGFVQMLGSIEIDTKRQVASGDLVMNERIDTFSPPGKSRFGLPVAGAFEVKNGKITAWRDYFCMKQFSSGTGISV
ncbi:MAG: limonene,2-epoxide hydrolase [Candidatus Binatota bacterium]|jgi:limonene-1,2-epoxide hydrolase|nr:limonene,2-epoxide hydrolase [Candidatus Binatota bacterium]